MSAEKMARRAKMDPNSTKTERSEMTQAGAPPGAPPAPGGGAPAPAPGPTGMPMGGGSPLPSMGGHGGTPEGAPGAGRGMGMAPSPGGQNAGSSGMSQPMQAGSMSGQPMAPGQGLGGMPGINVQQGNPMNGLDVGAPVPHYNPFGDMIPDGDPRTSGIVQVRPYSGMPTTWTRGRKLNDGDTPIGAQLQPPSKMAMQLEGVRLAKESWERNPNLNIMTMNRDGTGQMPSGMGIIGQPVELNNPIMGNMPQMGPDQQGQRQLGLQGMPDAEMAMTGNNNVSNPPPAGGMNLTSGQRA